MGIARDLNTTAEEDRILGGKLSDLERELRDINTTVARKQQQLEDYLTSGFKGTMLKCSEMSCDHVIDPSSSTEEETKQVYIPPGTK